MLLMIAAIFSNFIIYACVIVSKLLITTSVGEFAFLIISLLFCGIAQLLISCYLFFFGCCVSVGKSNTASATKLIEDHEEKNYCMQVFKMLLQKHIKFKESVSLGLFLIFTLLTIVVIFFIFVTIRMLRTEFNMVVTCYIVYCIQLILIIVYLALAADDTDKIRLDLINTMW